LKNTLPTLQRNGKVGIAPQELTLKCEGYICKARRTLEESEGITEGGARLAKFSSILLRQHLEHKYCLANAKTASVFRCSITNHIASLLPTRLASMAWYHIQATLWTCCG